METGKSGLDEANDGEVGDEHGRDGDREGIGAEEGLAGSVPGQEGLETEFDGREEGREIDGDIGGDGETRVLDPPRTRPVLDEAEDRVAEEGQDEGHIEAIRPEGEEAAVAEDEGLDEEGHR